jgi:hypothetical protein
MFFRDFFGFGRKMEGEANIHSVGTFRSCLYKSGTWVFTFSETGFLISAFFTCIIPIKDVTLQHQNDCYAQRYLKTAFH